jgi:polar amino acid transport system substrate-binding protein
MKTLGAHLSSSWLMAHLLFRASLVVTPYLMLMASLMFTASLGLSSAAQARELLAVGTHFSQVFEVGADGEFRGIAVDILKSFAHDNGHSVRFESYPWLRAQSMVHLGKADILIGPYKNANRERLLAFSAQGFYRDQMVFYVQKSSAIAWQGNFDELQHHLVGDMLGWYYGDGYQEAKSRLRVVSFEKLKGAVERLLRGDIDLLAANKRNMRAILTQLNKSDALESLEPIITIQDGYFAFPKMEEFAAIRTQFDISFDDMVRRGELARLALLHAIAVPQTIKPVATSNESRATSRWYQLTRFSDAPAR